MATSGARISWLTSPRNSARERSSASNGVTRFSVTTTRSTAPPSERICVASSSVLTLRPSGTDSSTSSARTGSARPRSWSVASRLSDSKSPWRRRTPPPPPGRSRPTPRGWLWRVAPRVARGRGGRGLSRGQHQHLLVGAGEPALLSRPGRSRQRTPRRGSVARLGRPRTESENGEQRAPARAPVGGRGVCVILTTFYVLTKTYIRHK